MNWCKLMVLYLTLSHIEPLPSSLVILLAMRFTCIAACSNGPPTAPSWGATATTRRSSTHGVEQRRTSCKGQQDSHPEVRFMSYVQSFPLVFPYWFRWFHMILQCSTHFMSIFTSRIFIKWSQNLEANLSITTRPPLWQRTLQTLGLS